MGVIPPWSDLPEELLSAIVECLTSSPIDILTFRSVCKSWYSSSSSLSLSSTLFPPLPLVTPNPPHSLRHRFSGSDLAPYTLLSVTAIYALLPPIQQHSSSCMPKVWVLFLDQSISGKVSIRKPFTRSSYSLPINFPRNLNLLDFNASELGRFYNLSYVPNPDGKPTKSCRWFECVLKVVVFSNDIYLAVVVLSDEGKLGLLRLGSGFNYVNLATQPQWEIIHDGKGFRFDDVVDFNGRILGIDRRGRVYEIEIGSSSYTTKSAIVTTIAGGGGRRKRLVESLGRLYLIVRCNARGETDGLFKVYELNEGSKKWVEVKSIGDRTFFVGVEFSFSAPAEVLHGSYGKNCILFGERSFLNYSGYDDDSALYHKLESRALHVGLWRMEDVAHLGVIGSHPGYSELLWPPPTWIWPNHQSERVGILLAVLDRLQVKVPDYEKLKAKFEKLSPLQQKGALMIMKSAINIKEILIHTRKISNMLKQIDLVAELWQRKSLNLQNQVGTSTLRGEDRLAYVEPFQIIQNAMKLGDCNFDLLSMEMNLHNVILRLEEETSEVELALDSPKFSTFFGG